MNDPHGKEASEHEDGCAHCCGVTEIRVRYHECDPMGVAHHAAYAVWCEMGRTEMLRSRGVSYRDLEADGVLLVVVRLAIDYKRPACYDDLVSVYTTRAGVGRVKIEHEYRLQRGDELLATAQTTLACLDRNGRPQPLPSILQDDHEESDCV